MTIYDFKVLNETDQADAVWDGILLATRTERPYKILLYDLGGFYVEIYYNAELNRIEKLRPFKDVSTAALPFDKLPCVYKI